MTEQEKLDIIKLLKGELDEFKKANKKEHDAIIKSLTPILEDRIFRKALDDKVGKWLPRMVVIVPVVSAILYYMLQKAVGPLLNQLNGN